MRQRILSIAVLLAMVSPAQASSPAVPVGGEFQVNTFTPSDQAYTSISADAAGNFVVVWVSDSQDGSGHGVFGQRFSVSGAPLGTEFQVNTHTLGYQGVFAASIELSSAADGAFVVAWPAADGYGYGIFARRYDNTGTPIGTEFQVSTHTLGYQSFAAVASAPNGDFVVAWTDSSARDGYGSGVFARRFASSGVPLGGDFQVNTYTPWFQGESGPHLAFEAGGGFVAVWDSLFQTGDNSGVFGQRFDSSGGAIGTEFQISTYTTVGQNQPSVAASANGNFVVVWAGAQDGSLFSTNARRFDSAGNALGEEFVVNTYTPGVQSPWREAVFEHADGFVIVWVSIDQDGFYSGVFGQQFDSSGTRLGTELQINTYTPREQSMPVVAGGSSGEFVVAWQSQLQDGSSSGVFAQRFATPIGACPATVDGGCATGFAKGQLFVKQDVAGKEKLIMKMVRGPALTQTALGNPLEPGGTIYSLCIYDDGGALAAGVSASVVVDRAGDDCGGLACWSAVGGDPPAGKGYKYRDSALAADGVLKLLYKGGGPGKSKAIVKGKGANIPVGIPAALQTTTFATMQLRASDGICLSVVVDGIKRQQPAYFKANVAAP